jgi:hypothetical protein
MVGSEPSKPKVSLDKIGAGVNAVTQKRGKEAKDTQEEAALSEARSKAEIASITESNRDLRVNRRMRYDYARAVFCYLICYSAFAGVVLILSGWKIGGFDLPSIALTAVVGSTAASAIGLVGIVVTGLFRPQAARSSRNKGKRNA